MSELEILIIVAAVIVGAFVIVFHQLYQLKRVITILMRNNIMDNGVDGMLSKMMDDITKSKEKPKKKKK